MYTLTPDEAADINDAWAQGPSAQGPSATLHAFAEHIAAHRADAVTQADMAGEPVVLWAGGEK